LIFIPLLAEVATWGNTYTCFQREDLFLSQITLLTYELDGTSLDCICSCPSSWPSSCWVYKLLSQTKD